jgi:threonine dehydratase
VSGYSDPDVIAGAATVALEILEDSPETGTFVVPIGGGGLIAGVAETVKTLRPCALVIGVETAASCPFQTSLRAGGLVRVEVRPTLADGLSGNPDPATITFTPIQRFVDHVVTVTEDLLANAIVGLLEHEHLVAEGAGAAGVAALVGRQINGLGRHAAIIVTGSNIDIDRLQTVLVSRPRA